MKNKILFIALFLVLIIPIKCYALSSSYTDIVAPISETPVEENKVNLYLFHGAECPHCKEERQWLDNIKEKYNDKLNVYYYEVWHDKDNLNIMGSVCYKLNIDCGSVPFTVIGDKYFNGFSDAAASRIENLIKEYTTDDESSGEDSKNNVNIPILGNINMKNVSIPLVSIILGFIDGFNPCAMWILLLLISLLFGMEDKKRAWILGITFLFISALVYFISLLGINIILGIATINWMKILIALFILGAGIFNLKKYLKIRKEEAGCTVVDDKKRKKLITKMRNIIKSKSFGLSFLGIIVLAATVNLIEMACSLGFPLIFNEILTVNNIFNYIYILLYD